MAAGSAFTLTPNTVSSMPPEYNNVQTQSESMKKEYYNISANAVERHELEFKALSSADMNVLLTHYKDQSAGYYPFSWQSVPNHINSGANITGRWIEGSLDMTPISNRWKCSITFEKAV